MTSISNNNQKTTPRLGTVRIAPGVLATIVRETTLAVDGVVRVVSPATDTFSRLFGRENRDFGNDGIKIEMKDGKVYTDLYIIVTRSANMVQVGKLVQADVARAIRDILALPVEQINVYIQNVE